MSDARTLSELARLQSLKEHGNRSALAKASKSRRDRSQRETELREASERAGAAMDAVFAATELSLDRMQLAAGNYAIAQEKHADGQAALSRAETAEGEAQAAWRTSNLRTDHLVGLARAARRHEARRAEDTRLAGDLSLRAALEGDTRQ